MSALTPPLNVSLRQLETLRLFARTKSVTETARLLGISQPAVSQTLKEIEGQFGFSLFVRERGRTRLTAETMAIQPELERIFTDMRQLRGKAEELRDVRGGSLSIATVTTFTGAVLPETIAAFRRERDQVRIRLDVYTAGEVVRNVLQEYADVGFAFLPIDDTGIAVHPILEIATICLLPAGHPLWDRDSVTIEDLTSGIVIAHGTRTPPGVMMRETLSEEKLARLEVLQTNNSSAALHLVQAGVAPALSHPLVLAFDTMRNIKPVRFEPEIRLTLAMLYPRSRPVPRLLRRFERVLRGKLQDYAETVTARGLYCKVLA
jgi:DNA-binding transcriptional LysR family regulator